MRRAVNKKRTMTLTKEDTMTLTEAQTLAIQIREDQEAAVLVLSILPVALVPGRYFVLCCTGEGWVFAVLNPLMWQTKRVFLLHQRAFALRQQQGPAPMRPVVRGAL